ncbi:MAG: 6-phosphogluconolactonase [Chlorobiaceae bacterium]|nr:6-phosphogluconolactonase [Chlorobiaceae bacterium]NTW11282.1 6-phosphogluconolactonase [Chlorobiaceae bacterium]
METAERAAAFIIRMAWQAVSARGVFALALSGGASPRPLYRNLALGIARDMFERFTGEALPDGYSLPDMRTILMPWQNTRLYWSDERCVPPLDTRSNYRMAMETLLESTGPAEDCIFRMPAEHFPPLEAAGLYETELRRYFNEENRNLLEGFPVFDLILLGMGDDGHTASLFPGNSGDIAETSRWVMAVMPPSYATPGTERLTFTLPVINHARNVLFFIAGSSRATIVEKILSGKEQKLPASLVRPRNGNLYWFCAQP